MRTSIFIQIIFITSILVVFYFQGNLLREFLRLTDVADATTAVDFAENDAPILFKKIRQEPLLPDDPDKDCIFRNSSIYRSIFSATIHKHFIFVVVWEYKTIMYYRLDLREINKQWHRIRELKLYI